MSGRHERGRSAGMAVLQALALVVILVLLFLVCGVVCGYGVFK